jgi:hypothetical protein
MVNLVLVAIALVLVVGLIQYLKKVWAKAPNWVWMVALPVFSTVVYLVLSVLPDWLIGISLVIAGGQLFYETVVKFIEKLREKLTK